LKVGFTAAADGIGREIGERAGFVVARKSKEEIDEAEVTLSSSSDEKVEKVEDLELGLELLGERDSGEDSGDGKIDMEGISSANPSRVGVGDIIEV